MNIVLKKRLEHKRDREGTYSGSVLEIVGFVEVEGLKLKRSERIYTDLAFESKERTERIQKTINEIITDLLNRAEILKKNIIELRELLEDFEEVIN